MEIVAVPDPALGNTSYLVDLGDGSGLVVDPERDPRPYVDAAQRHRVAIRYVAETHLHADFVSGSRELIDVAGAELIAPVWSRLAYPYTPVADQEELTVGDLTMRVLATPGHTPEHVSYVFYDGTRPEVLFSGGTLMAGGVARPDLVSPSATDSLARSAYRSVRRLFQMLPDHVEVRPTHGAGSFCSSGPSTDVEVSTVGSERSMHPAATADDEDAFVENLLSGLGTFPRYFLRLRALNQAGPRIYGLDLPPLELLGLDGVDRLLAGGGLVIDARPIARFGAGHIPGSISNELRGQFGTWLGWLVDQDTQLAFVVDDDQDQRELVRQALNIGHEAVGGRVDLSQWISAGRELATSELVPAGEIGAEQPLIDVRQRSEYDAVHVPGALHVELAELDAALERVPAGAVVHCGHGQRAMTAVSLFARAGKPTQTATTAGPVDITRARTGIQ